MSGTINSRCVAAHGEDHTWRRGNRLPSQEMGEVCPVFIRIWTAGENGESEIAKGIMVTVGVYEAT